ncbi:hypothetical protein QWZ13_16390 [Reinekea marina]|uniref:hypothetical protein n=1 Tax=Reinekea marina TaxID=1310421 RepID=UPI0025B4A964|nr:hypothetical protein [Reinekea marina]MDN3650487.1 hypothetical protein [Reinekea marina]
MGTRLLRASGCIKIFANSTFAFPHWLDSCFYSFFYHSTSLVNSVGNKPVTFVTFLQPEVTFLLTYSVHILTLLS